MFGVVVDDGDVPSGGGYASGAVDVFGGRPGGWMYVVVRHLTVGVVARLGRCRSAEAAGWSAVSLGKR